MKKIFRTNMILLFAVSILFSGCNDFLTKYPVSALSTGNFWQSKSDVDAALAGMYDGLQNTLGQKMFLWGEIRSDNFQQSGTGTNQVKFISNGLTSDMAICSWTTLYKTISSANNIIKYVPTVTVLSESQRNDYLAQAYSMRALMYFWAIRIWGSVPLIVEPYEGKEGQERFLSRSPLEEVNKLILSDLELASQKISASTSSIYYFNKGSVLALQTDVFMWLHKYQEALDASNQLMSITRYGYATTPTEWKSIFESPTSSKESIMNIYWDYVKDEVGNDYAAEFASGSLNPQYKIRKELFDTLINRKTDARLWNMIDTVQLFYIGRLAPLSSDSYNLLPMNMPIIKYTKFDPTYGIYAPYGTFGGYKQPINSECSFHLVLYRYSDIMLLRAEALNKTGKQAEARTIVNYMRTRMGYKTLVNDTNTPDEATLENAILLERQIELLTEGKRWFDLARTGKTVEIMDPILKAAPYNIASGFNDTRRILFPLHQSVFEANKNLIQNEPYTQN